MSVDGNVAAVRRLLDRFVNAGDVQVADEIFAHDCVNHVPPPDPPGDFDSIKRFVRDLREVFPDMHYDIVHLVGAGDVVALNLLGTATHRGTWRGIAPTGRRVQIAVMSFFTFRDGRIVARHNITDVAGVVRQLTE